MRIYVCAVLEVVGKVVEGVGWKETTLPIVV